MSWDLFIQDWGDVDSLNDIPDDFEPKPIGLRSDIIRKVNKAEPTVDFSNPTLGRLKNDQFSIEFKMGENEEIMSFTMHVRGTELAVPCIGNILEQLDFRAADGSDDKFFDIESAMQKFSKWIDYKNKMINK